MTDTTEQPRPPGRVGPHRESHEPRLLLSQFRTAFGELPNAWDGSNGITDWGMDGNDQWGDCGAAATDHGNMAKASNADLFNTLGKPTYDGTLPTYWAYGLSQGETGTPPAPADEPDQGVDNATWLGFLYEKGIIDGYGEVPLNQLHQYAVDFNGLLLGVTLSDNAQQEFQAGTPWGSPGDVPDPSLGHDVWFIKYNADGSASVITWGAEQPVTTDFINRFVTDAWAILDEDDANRVGVDWSLLQGVLNAIHGTVSPVDPQPPVTPPAPDPVPPAPQPDPAPPVPPEPGPVDPPMPSPLVDRLEAWARKEIKEIIHLVEEAGGSIPEWNDPS